MRKFLALVLCLTLLPLKAGAAEFKYVALTFDDGPSGRYTRQLLEGLRERSAKATFLLCGYRIVQYPELTEQIFREGHEIGIHGFSHALPHGGAHPHAHGCAYDRAHPHAGAHGFSHIQACRHAYAGAHQGPQPAHGRPYL